MKYIFFVGQNATKFRRQKMRQAIQTKKSKKAVAA